MSGYEQYEKTKETLKRVFSFKDDFRKFYGNKTRKNIQEAANTMMKQLDELVTKDKVSWSKKDVDCVNHAVAAITDILITTPVNPMKRDLSREFGRLTINWNKQQAKNAKLGVSANALYRLSRNAKTLADAEMVIRKMIVKAEKTVRHVPASWELSKHYLKSLEKNIE